MTPFPKEQSFLNGAYYPENFLLAGWVLNEILLILLDGGLLKTNQTGVNVKKKTTNYHFII